MFINHFKRNEIKKAADDGVALSFSPSNGQNEEIGS